MLIKHLLGDNDTLEYSDAETLRTECSQFFKESESIPVFKLLPSNYGKFQKVKVRQRRSMAHMTPMFTEAFNYTNLSNRAVFAYPLIEEHQVGLEPFFVFPINGYRFLYNKEVQNSNENYSDVLTKLAETIVDDQTSFDIVVDLLKYTYHNTNLAEGLSSKSEIIFYNIPYYYAVRKTAVVDYAELAQ